MPVRKLADSIHKYEGFRILFIFNLFKVSKQASELMSK